MQIMTINKMFNHKIVNGLRAIMIVIIGIYGWWMVAGFRTQTFGTDGLFKHIIAATIFVLPLSIVPFIGLKLKLLVKSTVFLFVTILLSALLWSSIEELIVMHNTPLEDDKTIIIKRWKPFPHHDIVYSPEKGWYAND